MILFRFLRHGSLAVLLLTSAAEAQLSIKANSTNLLDKRFAAASTTVANGAVTLITVRNAGSGYILEPAVTIAAPPTGNTATATATVGSGVVTGITINFSGTGYTSAPVIRIAPPPVYNPAGSPTVTTSQYAGQANTASTSGPINATAVANEIPGFAQGRFPRGYDKSNPATPVTTMVLGRASFGYSFASGVPRYSLGEEIPRPSLNWKGDTVASIYWRVEPVKPGETFSSVGSSNLGVLGTGNVPLPAGTVTVNSSAANSPTVTVAAVPDTLTPGAILLGKMVAYISGNTVTLVTPPSITTASATVVPFTPRQSFYYSPHARRVFASQPGRVTVTWVSSLPDTSGTNEAGTNEVNATYKFRQETFAVSSSSRFPARTVYWTGNGFSAPAVQIPSGRITVANPIYNSFVPPGVATAYTPVGANPGNMTMPEEHRTVWFDQVANTKSLNAYNIEGMLMVEYLGAQTGDGASEFLGADVVEIKSTPEVVTVTTSLGDELLTREGSPAAGDELLKPAVAITDAKARLGSYQSSDGVSHYYAEKENLDPDQVRITWMERTDAAIYFLTEPATPNLNLEWPKRHCAYLLKWPDRLADYVAVNVQSTGNTAVNALQFDPSSLPENKFQDCAPEVETEVDPTTQRLLVDLSRSQDQTNRTLLKFSYAEGLWYQRFYIQADSDTLVAKPAVPDPDGAGPGVGIPAVPTINDTNADGIADSSLTATVGARLEPPSGYETGGYISSGTCYSPGAYLNPFEVGFPAAATKAIIPVNAATGANTLRVWWSKKITPPSPKLKPFYVPSLAATYTVSYPANPQELVIASGKGLENPVLTAEQAAGSLYVQNDSTLPGYNPNEEHGLMIGGNVYALRDDLNNTTATAAFTSQPYVLISYQEASTGRAAMRVAKVIRSNDTYPLAWNKAAGTPVQAPMPLALLPLPLTNEADPYSVRNAEVAGVSDHATSPTAPTETTVPVNYNSFTFRDRKGMHWLYRGPHSTGTTPSFAMRYYYKSLPGFFVPGISLANQPAVGTIMPYIGADVNQHKVSGDATLLTYYPKWPDDTVFGAQAAVVPGLKTAQTLMLPASGLPQVRGQTSAQVAYQQSIANNSANGGTTVASVILSDPTRQKTYDLGSSGGLPEIPPSVLTTQSSGRTYFQGLPPHLQNRFYLDPNRGAKGALVLIGEFIDVPAGEDYLNLNALSVADIALLKGLCPSSEDSSNRTKWETAINQLSTKFETFSESTTVPGSYVVDPQKDKRSFDPSDLPDVSDPDTAVDSYALSATGGGTGYVTLVFGNGEAFTDPGDPVVLQIIKVSPDLYPGDLKVLLSSNPLDEQVTLRHSGDYGAKPENFEFQWRYGFPVDGSYPAQNGVTATATASLGVSADSFTITSGTHRYSANPAVTISGGNGTEATASARMGVAKESFTIAGGTERYSAAPAVAISGGGGTGATATALLGLSAQSFTITSNLQRYSVAPTVAISGGGGTGATATAVLTSGAVTSLTNIYSGSGYTTTPTIAFSGGTVSTAGTAPTGTGNATNFVVNGITLTNPGGGFTSAPSITFSGGTVSAAGTAPGGTGNATNFVASGITILTAGADFTTAPSLAFSGGTTTFTGTAPSATGNATHFVVSEVSVVSAGSQYANTPAVSFSGGGGTAAAATAVVGASRNISSVTVTTQGSGYSSVPTVTLEVPVSPISLTTATTNWLMPSGTLGSSVLVGGSPAAVLSDPAILMGDCYFTMAYRLKAAGAWSTWTSPVLVEGWIKRVLAKITPFNQRMTDLSSSVINTDVSMLTQAGIRWEGDIALNLDNINDVGLIAIYETILNRGKSFTVGNGIDFSTTNDALLLAAGYLNDLYVILGNEAYADAANPTISIDDAATATEVNTSRFSFEGQVASSLDEELGLLRGRDDFTSPGTSVAPGYNRLYWNYTRGINSGEALYATNYNIKEKTGSPTANGMLDAADAQRMFPQGHGDSYGHYLTAVTNYYKLLTHPYFTWTPRAEGVTVLGQTVLVDYQDERKFAGAAARVASSAQQILALVHRKSYSDDTSIGWTNLRDTATNSRTGETRDWGLDEWASRSAQGSFFHWVTGNSLLLANDNAHSGVQKIDRSTVPELDQLVTAADSFQTTLDNANAHLNPLGLSPAAIAFDISPGELKNGKSHYEQIEDRALSAVLNAKGAFNQAARMTRLLRHQDNQVSDKNTSVVEQERAYSKQLLDIYGAPYAGDLGAGKTYPQGYAGPDLVNWSIIDRPSTIMVDTTKLVSIRLRVPTATPSFGALSVEEIQSHYDGSSPVPLTQEKSFDILPNQFAQFADLVSPGSSLGSRPQTGALQQALLDAEAARAALMEANYQLQTSQSAFDRKGQQVLGILEANLLSMGTQSLFANYMEKAELAAANLRKVADIMTASKEVVSAAADAYSEALPTVVGLANDATSAARGGIKIGKVSIQSVYDGTINASNFSADMLEAMIEKLKRLESQDLAAIEYDKEAEQTAYEFDILSKNLLGQVYRISDLMARMRVADQQVKNHLAAGLAVIAERESFRQRAAAVVSGYRTNDLTFRTFRNEALEQYRSLYDLASRYTYLAAKSYDYETGLLGTPQGQAVISRVVAARSLGDLTGDLPQATASTLGDAGLAGTIAQMNADFSVVKGRLGINNPDQYGTLFSLRSERYRLGSSTTADNDAWQQTLEQSIKANLMSDPDVVRYCNNLKKPDGSAVPGFVIEFSSTIQHSRNFFGLPTAVGDHAYSPSSYSTKISSAGIVLKGYVGMDPYAQGNPGAGGPNLTDPNSLSASPYLYLIPCGEDSMLAPPLGDTNTLRSWTVHDQALPLPFNLGASAFNTTQLLNAAGTLSEQPWIQRKHQGFRPVSDAAFFYSSVPAEFTNSRLVGRSAWNSKWKIVIPANTLLNDEQDGMTRFSRSVQDIQLFLRTYSHSGN
jgi:hypothetical protein